MAVTDWSQTASANQAADANINWQEGQAANTINNSARAMMAALAMWRDDNLGALVATLGTGNVYSVTSNSGITDPITSGGSVFANAFSIEFMVSAPNTGPATLKVDALAAKPLRLPNATEFEAGELVAGRVYRAVYIPTLDAYLVFGGIDRVSADARYLRSVTVQLLDNANFVVNQRGVTSGTTAAGVAPGVNVMDRWKAGSTGCTFTFAQSGADVALNITAGSLLQIVEGRQIDAGTYTLSHDGTAQVRIYQGASVSFAAGPVTATGLAANTNTTVEFSTGTVSRAVLTGGTSAAPFRRRNIADEMVICQRFFRPLGGGGKAMAVTPTSIEFTFELSPPMRSAPSLAVPITTITCTRAGIGGSSISFGPLIDGSTTAFRARYYAQLAAGGTLTQGEYITSLTDGFITASCDF